MTPEQNSLDNYQYKRNNNYENLRKGSEANYCNNDNESESSYFDLCPKFEIYIKKK